VSVQPLTADVIESFLVFFTFIFKQIGSTA
jgi:hypothetical protein